MRTRLLLIVAITIVLTGSVAPIVRAQGPVVEHADELPVVVKSEEPLVIGKIEITTLDIYSQEEAARGWVYSATDALHIQTRESVVRKFLLFREGEVYHRGRLEETERNLRSQEIFKSASVTAGPPHNGIVDVQVVTQDSWSTEPGISLSSKGGTADWGVELTESNLLGTGRYFSVMYSQDAQRSKQGFRFRDPALFGPYWNSDFLYTDNSDGREESVTLRRRFHSLDTPWAVDVDLGRIEQVSKRYFNSYVSDEFELDGEHYGASFAHAFRQGEHTVHRLGTGFAFRSDKFRPIEDAIVGIPPDNRDYRYLFVDYQFFESRFRKLNFVSRDLRYEDFSLGTDFRLRLGVSPTFLGVDETTGMVQTSIARGFSLGPTSFIRPSISYETRLGTDARNSIFNFQTLLIRKFATEHPQTFVSRLAYIDGRDLDRDVQFYADGGTGLRGYRLYAFEGDKTLIANFEHRLFLGREILQFVSPGVAVFFDAGTAAREGQSLSLSDLKTDVGFGLRFGMVRSSRNMIRVDFAWALDPDPRGKQGLIVSFSSSQAF